MKRSLLASSLMRRLSLCQYLSNIYMCISAWISRWQCNIVSCFNETCLWEWLVFKSNFICIFFLGHHLLYFKYIFTLYLNVTNKKKGLYCKEQNLFIELRTSSLKVWWIFVWNSDNNYQHCSLIKVNNKEFGSCQVNAGLLNHQAECI